MDLGKYYSLPNQVGYIDDGCTLSGYVAEVPGLHPAVHFMFRPTEPTEGAKLSDDMEKAKDGPASELIAAAHVRDHVVDWDLTRTDKNGQTVAVSIGLNGYLKSQRAMGSKIFQIVAGFRASDIDPERDSRSNRNELEAELEAELQAERSGQNAVEESAKN